MNVKKLLQKIIENQRVSHMMIGLSANTTVSISATWSWVTLPFNSILDRSGLFASSSITSNCIVIPKDGIYRLSSMYTCRNGSYCSISVNGNNVLGGSGIQSSVEFTSAPVPTVIKKLNSGDKVGCMVNKSGSSNPNIAGSGATYLLVEKIG